MNVCCRLVHVYHGLSMCVCCRLVHVYHGPSMFVVGLFMFIMDLV